MSSPVLGLSWFQIHFIDAYECTFWKYYHFGNTFRSTVSKAQSSVTVEVLQYTNSCNDGKLVTIEVGNYICKYICTYAYLNGPH